jgi:hypothetical protein
MVFGEHGFHRFWADDFALEHLTWYVPECSVLWWPLVNPKPLQWFDWLRLAGFAVGFAYLVAPVAAETARQLRERVTTAWRALRGGPRFKF